MIDRDALWPRLSAIHDRVRWMANPEEALAWARNRDQNASRGLIERIERLLDEIERSA